jgi:hypothetical protein
MKGIVLYQALYKLSTRRRASSRSTDRMGLTCWITRFTGSRAAIIRWNLRENEKFSEKKLWSDCLLLFLIQASI